MDDLRRIWPEMHERHAVEPLACEFCFAARPATCVGQFHDEDKPTAACDECCDHKLKSGRCEPLASDNDATGVRS